MRKVTLYLPAVKRRVHKRKSYRESCILLRGDGWSIVEDGLGASHRTKGNIFGKAATGSPVIVAHCDSSVRYTDIVHKAAFREEAVN